MSNPIPVEHNPGQSRFESTVEGKMSFVQYEMKPGELILTHTEVPPELSGRGIGQELVRTALEHARRSELRVVALCSYVASYLKRHPEYGDLVSKR